jgi:hypothetical protein
VSDTLSTIAPTGIPQRAVRLAASTLLVGPVLAVIASGAPFAAWDVDSGVWVVQLLCAAPVAMLTWCWLRLPFTGVALDSDRLRLRSWWSSTTYSRPEVRHFRHENYDDFFYIVGWTIVDGRRKSGSLVLETRDGRSVPLPGTVASYKVARQQSEALNRWAGTSAGSGEGPRRRQRNSRRP